MTHYLVAADADQIQTFLFRSSRLREVIGGSMLLADFCTRVKDRLGMQAEVIISAGGGFRVEFAEASQAEAFKEALAEAFRQETGGTLTVVGPEIYEDGDFQQANQRLQQKLAEAKLDRPGCEAVFHLPVAAFCASCGVEIATRYDTTMAELPLAQQQRNYLCDACRSKAEHRHAERSVFYAPFYTALSKESAKQPAGAKDWNHIRSRYWDIPSDPADTLGALDPTRYVAYLLADGNGMGRLFNQQKSPAELRALSDRLEQALWTSLAAPVPYLAQRIEERDVQNRVCPVAPLIVGGDDVFAIVPARYALDSARLVCEVFEQQMEGKASLGIAVVICQNHYPYTLVHAFGEELLARSKRMGKSLGGVSAVTFGVITGSELVELGLVNGGNALFRPTLQPYWVGRQANQHAEAGMPLSMLLEQRLALKNLPGKRKAELRALFNPLEIGKLDGDAQRQQWEKRFDDLRTRLDGETVKKLAAGLAAPDEDVKKSSAFWRTVTRPDENAPYRAHWLLDLLEAWDYAYRLDLPDMVYELEEE